MDLDIQDLIDKIGFSSYQVKACIVMSVVFMYCSISPLSYAITAGDLKYRCEIPHCDNNSEYHQDWLESVIPFKNGQPAHCEKYGYAPSFISVEDQCILEAYNSSIVKRCDSWIFGESERTIVNDFGIMCDENKWKLTLVGIVNSVGQIIGIPVTGVLADRIGRRVIVVVGTGVSAVFGFLRSFSNNFYVFNFYEFAESLFSSGIYSVLYVLSLEFIVSKNRTVVTSIMNCFYPVGAILLGFVSSYTLDWRVTLRILYLPMCLFFFLLYWSLPESLEWLQLKKKYGDVASIIYKIADSKGKNIPFNVELELTSKDANFSQNPEEQLNLMKSLKRAFSSKTILLRLFCSSCCWFTTTLLYYGLTLRSVEMSGDKFTNFMLLNIVEIPAGILSIVFLEKFSRRNSAMFSFIFNGISCMVVNFMPDSYSWLQLYLFLCNKFAITISLNLMYMYTPEIFPTELRTSLSNLASTFGRFGILWAPQMAFFSSYFGENAPIIIFAITSFIAGATAFFLPETKDQKLPDTVSNL